MHGVNIWNNLQLKNDNGQIMSNLWCIENEFILIVKSAIWAARNHYVNIEKPSGKMIISLQILWKGIFSFKTIMNITSLTTSISSFLSGWLSDNLISGALTRKELSMPPILASTTTSEVNPGWIQGQINNKWCILMALKLEFQWSYWHFCGLMRQMRISWKWSTKSC